jgi:hypothetical protein
MNDFDNRASDPFFWLKQAKELDKAAMLIWGAIRQDLISLSHATVGTLIDLEQAPHANLGGVFWLNAGLALENLLKGVIIRGQPHLVDKGKIHRLIKTHDLFSLVKLASVEIDVGEAFYLRVGTVSVTWAGRYPCSTKPGELPPLLFSEADVTVYRKFFDRLVGRFGGDDSRSVKFKRLA